MKTTAWVFIIVLAVAVVAVAISESDILSPSGQQTYTRARTRARARAPASMNCQALSVTMHSELLAIQKKTRELNAVWLDFKKVRLQWQNVVNAAGAARLNRTNTTIFNNTNVTVEWLYTKKTTIKAELTKLTVEAMMIKLELTQMTASVHDLQLQVVRCHFEKLCPPCPGQPPVVQAECDYISVKLKEMLAQIDVIILDIHAEWEKYEKTTFKWMEKIEEEWQILFHLYNVTNETTIAGIPVAQYLTDNNATNLTMALNGSRKNIKKIKLELEQYKKKALDLHVEMVRIVARFRDAEAEVLRCIRRKCPQCPRVSIPDRYVTTPRDRVVTGPTPTEPLVTTGPQIDQVVDCNQLCAQQGAFSTQQQDWSQHILSFLQGYRCVSGARITHSVLRGAGCVCYSTQPPQISVDQTPPVCRGTPCGDVPCDGSAQCSCGPDCTMTVNCRWQGWRLQSPQVAVPIFGT